MSKENRNMRDIVKICDYKKCTGCEACVQCCPNKCINMIEDKDGFLYPYINNDKCLKCLRCVKVCHNNKNLKTYKSIFYMGWHKNIEVLKRSSSGGAFTAIADLILERGGVVFGAEFDKNTRRVKHIAIENKKDMDKIRLSKYYQGTIDDSYVMIKELLKNRWVLFSGTACQIAGLYSFLGENYDNLITVDVLCHGVASYKVVNEYILDKERKYKKRIVDFKFRLKPNDADWLNGGMKLIFDDGTSSIENRDKDTYFVGFNNYLFLRKSCYNCKYTGTNRISDFTLADYWGVPLTEISYTQIKYGVSLVLANTIKAQNLISSLKKDMEINKIEPEKAIANNQALERPSTFNVNRDAFFKLLGEKNFDSIVHKYNAKYYNTIFGKSLLMRMIGESLYNRLKRFVKRS